MPSSVNAFGNAGALSPTMLGDGDNFSTSMRPRILQDWRIPVSVMFDIDTNVLAAEQAGNASINALNSLSFSKTGPAFLLSKGFTVNAPELNIFDNRWIDPRVSAVPIPAGLPLLLAGLGAFGFLRRKQSI